jgi:hypothetical protein
LCGQTFHLPDNHNHSIIDYAHKYFDGVPNFFIEVLQDFETDHAAT